IRAICKSLTIRETRDDGGMARFSLEFIEAPAQAITPTIAPALGDQVTTSSAGALIAVKTDFQNVYKFEGLPSFALASAQTAITNMATALHGQLSHVVKDTDELARVNGQLNVIISEASLLARQPDIVLDRFHDAIAGLTLTATSAPGDLLHALIKAY